MSSYEVRSIDLGTRKEIIIDIKSTDPTFIMTDLTPGHAYFFMVGSLREDGSGTLSGPSETIEILQNPVVPKP